MPVIRALVLLQCSVIAVGCTSSMVRPFSLRALTLHVVDAGTGAPLEGVPVAYMVQTRVSRVAKRPSPAGHMVDVGPLHSVRLRGVTDAKGLVTFRVGTLTLAPMEEFESERILLNVRGEMDAPLAGIVRRVEEDACENRHPMCRLPVEDIDVVWRVAQDGPDARAQVLRRPLPDLEGMLLVVRSEPPSEGMTSWIGKEEPFVLRYHHSEYRKAETVVVELRRPRPKGARDGR